MEKPEMEQIMKKAEVLIEALPYIQKFNRKIIVVKYGGSAMSNEELQKNVIKDVTLLKLVGFKPIIVHGGGKEISALLERLQVETHFENGYRVTDQTVLETAEMALSARVNKSIVAALDRIGAKACGISGYLLGVNPFDQPGVEAYKKNMFALLGKKGYEQRKKYLEGRM